MTVKATVEKAQLLQLSTQDRTRPCSAHLMQYVHNRQQPLVPNMLKLGFEVVSAGVRTFTIQPNVHLRQQGDWLPPPLPHPCPISVVQCVEPVVLAAWKPRHSPSTTRA